MSIRFEWDPAKNDANQRKHGLRFEDAKPIFIWDADRFDELRGAVTASWARTQQPITIVVGGDRGAAYNGDAF